MTSRMNLHVWIAAVALTGGSGLAGAQSVGTGLFASPFRAFETGLFPNFAPGSMATGDMDGDGVLDAVVGHEYYGGPGLSVLFGRGDGTFERGELYNFPYGDSIGDVALADVDGDGDPDILATIPNMHGQGTEITYWRNDGLGGFTEARRFVAGTAPFGFAVADFTGDGFPDVVTANYGRLGQGTTIALLEHNALSGDQAGFLNAVPFSVQVGPKWIAAGDLDGDQDLDLYIGRDATNGHCVMMNDGHGNFDTPRYFVPVPGSERVSAVVELADVDNDNDLDLIAHGADNGIEPWGIVAIRYNDGSGQFSDDSQYILPEGTWLAQDIDQGDFNGDGFVDLAITSPDGRSDDGVTVVLNNRSGGFFGGTHYGAAKQTWAVEVADADADGDDDLLTAANDSSVVTFHRNPGDGRFPILRRYFVGTFVQDQDGADIDLDGDVDLVTCGSDVQILKNNGDGSFQGAIRWVPPIDPGEIRLRDMNNDGYPDILLGPDRNAPPYNFAVALNQGDGSFGSGVVTQVNASQAGNIGAWDLNNDGLLDVVLTDPGALARIHIARNTGNGTNFVLMTPITDVGLPFGIDAADFNHDGNMDLVSNTAFGLSVFPGNGDFTFADFLATGESGSYFKAADMDADGNDDLVYVIPQDSFGTVYLGLMLGYGDGDFDFPREYSGPTGREGAFRIVSDADVADVTGDGRFDFLVTSNAANDVSVFAGGGDGTLAPSDRYGIGYSAQSSVVADFTGDGILDLASLISLPPLGFDNAVVLLEGQAQAASLELEVSPLRRGQQAFLTATRAQPAERVYFLYSLAGVGDGPCVGALGGLCLDLLLPITNMGFDVADDTGWAVMSVNVPRNAPLVDVHFQAVARRGTNGNESVKSNAVTATIQP